MESPFRSEAAAFRFLLVTIGAFALIVLASAASTALGFLTFIALSLQPSPSTFGSAGRRPRRSTSTFSAARTNDASSWSRTRRSPARSS